MIVFVLLLGFVACILTLIVAFSMKQQNQTKKLLERLKAIPFKKINIRYSQISADKGSVVGGTPFQALMYLSDNLIFITPKEKGYFSALLCANLPLIIVKDPREFSDLIEIGKLIRPDKISLTPWNAINITLGMTAIFYRKYYIQIRMLDKSDIESLNVIRNW